MDKKHTSKKPALRHTSRKDPTTKSLSQNQEASLKKTGTAKPQDWERETDKIFAKLVVCEGFLSPQQIKECLAELDASGPKDKKLNLGQILVKKRLIDPQTFLDLHRRHQELSMRCSACNKDYSLNEISHTQTLLCPQCKERLEEPEKLKQINLGAGSRQSAIPFDSDFGNYTLLEEVGRGGMGIVFKAKQKGIERIVALKVMRQLDTMDEEQIARFQREITTIGKLNHPNIVSIYDAGKMYGNYYFAMEFIEGDTLADIIEKNPPSIDLSVEIMEKVASAVHYAHTRQIIHRDLKPANIIVDREGEPHITDFGLAKDISHTTRLTQSGMAMGTPYYMAPEQIEGKSEDIEAATDVYAMGVILYELLTGAPPFSAPTAASLYSKILSQEALKPSKTTPSIPVTLDTIVLKALEKKIFKRYTSAKAFASDLKRFRTGKRILARSASPFEKLLRVLNRHAIWLLPVLILSLFCVTFCILWLRSSWSPKVKQDFVSQEIEKRLKESEGLFSEKKFTMVQEKINQILSLHGDHVRALSLYELLGKSYENVGNIEDALKTYQKFYIYAGDVQNEIKALKGMMRCSIKSWDYRNAHRILQTVLNRFKGNEQLDPDLIGLIVQTLFHVADFNQALAFMEKLNPEAQNRPDEEDCITYKRWLGALTPVKRYICEATGVALIDVLNNGHTEIAIINGKSLKICSIEKDEIKILYQIRCPSDNEFSDIAAGDLDGDGEFELATLTKQKNIVIFKRKGDDFHQMCARKLNADVTQIWVGDLDKSGKAAILLGIGGYTRDTKILCYDGKKNFEVIYLDGNLKRSNTDTLAVDVGDIDCDGTLDIILGTSSWTFYDLRAYGYKNNIHSFHLKGYKRLGIVTGCKVVDMDQDGIPEILATKSRTVNSEVFGESSPCGEPDGVYVFHYAPGNFKEIWRYTYPACKNPRRMFSNLSTGYIKNVGQVAALQYMETKSMKIGCFERSENNQEIWMMGIERGKYHIFRFARENGFIQCILGDIDGDKSSELIVLEKGAILIYGMD